MRLYPPKILSAVRNFIQRKAKERRVYVSLLLLEDGVFAAAWSVSEGGGAQILATTKEIPASAGWDEKIAAAERAIARLENTIPPDAARNVVFGLPHAMLTPSGDIRNSIRAQMKKLVHSLRLTPIGYVALDTALAFVLKQEEGVPASVILLGVSGANATLTVYKVGNVVGSMEREMSDGIADVLEESLMSIKNLEVLPSRILLYGSDSTQLETVRRRLMKHPWTTKVNFLHFPKIDVLTEARLAGAVCLAGASQLPQRAGEERNVSDQTETQLHGVPVGEPDRKDVQAPDEAPGEDRETGDDDESKQTDGHTVDTVEADDDDESDRKREEEIRRQDDTEKEETEEGQISDTGDISDDRDHNVVVVKPEALGFRSGDVLEEVVISKKKASVDSEPDAKRGVETPMSVPPVSPSVQLQKLLRSIRIPALPKGVTLPAFRGVVLILAGLALLFMGAGLSYWAIPRATVTIFELPMELSEKITLVVDPDAQAVDTEKNVIPGRNQAKSVDGEKTIAVTGKKKVGDPASGTATIYNKSLTARLFSKGTVLSHGALRFTLDQDVTIASASENLVNGTVTFGKANATITASAIGTQGNLPAGGEFTIQDLPSNVAIARNEAELTGGTSREVTVVTRDDQDILIDELTKELVAKAKDELSASVTGGEKLIDDTIQTKIVERNFAQELDQESTELQGSITVEVTGVSYNEDDVYALLSDSLSGRLPEGFAIVEGKRILEIQNVVVAKDGTIRVNAALATTAAATLDLNEVGRNLAGKTRDQAVAYLKSIQGVAAASFDIRWSIGVNRLPYNQRNISVSIALAE